MDRLFAILVILIIISSLFVFIKNYQDVRGAFSKELFTSFIAIYFILMLGFALLYFLLSEAGFHCSSISRSKLVRPSSGFFTRFILVVLH